MLLVPTTATTICPARPSVSARGIRARGGAALRLAALLGLTSLCLGGVAVDAQETFSPIERRIPPAGIELPAEQHQALRTRLQSVQTRLGKLEPVRHRADVAVLLKAVRLALKHGEFYRDADVAKAEELLALAESRVAELEAAADPSWLRQKGLVVRGYWSPIDGSPQPYGLVIPDDLDLSGDSRVPLYVWLHGRGDKTTDMHFLHQRMHQVGQIAPPNAIVVHPFGRHCVGFKSAGERDVLDVVRHVLRQYPVDPDRVILMGFSMGGAGAWHLGAHYVDHWAAVSPGAGFAETAEYNRLTRDQFPNRYEQALWGLYDVPAYVRNLFNVPVVAYSGENDKQIQAARVMEAAYQQQDRELPHLIGPGMGHKYHPETLAELLERMQQAAREGRPAKPQTVHLQTRTLRYAQQYWVEALGLEQHWQDSRVDARIVEDRLEVQTRNITRLRLTPPSDVARIVIDDQTLEAAVKAGEAVTLGRDEKNQWAAAQALAGLRKRPGLQGPIDDVWLEPFLVVLPTGEYQNARHQRWVEFELKHFLERWQALFRGRARVKKDTEVTADDIARFHLVVWGDPQSNQLLARALGHQDEVRLPLNWTAEHVELGTQRFSASDHLPALIYPNPLNPERYMVLNSGPTFRESHDRTNSLQNPKLPDWAVIDVTVPPSGEAPGGVPAMGFFDEQWQPQQP